MARATVLQTSAETPRPPSYSCCFCLRPLRPPPVSRLPLAIASSPPALLPRLSYSYVRLLLTKPAVHLGRVPPKFSDCFRPVAPYLPVLSLPGSSSTPCLAPPPVGRRKARGAGGEMQLECMGSCFDLDLFLVSEGREDETLYPNRVDHTCGYGTSYLL